MHLLLLPLAINRNVSKHQLVKEEKFYPYLVKKVFLGVHMEEVVR